MTSTKRTADRSERSLADSYARPTSGFDEFVDASGAVRAHWKPLLREIDLLDDATRRLRMEQLDARVRETGIAHDVFSDPLRARQPWRVDLVPLVIAENEWRLIEKALLQRAHLFERILSDIYGPQNLLESGAIPHQLVFSDPSFLRPCHTIRPSGGYLQFFASDIARGPDGQWRVIDTHTETPAGIGYALANRTIHTNVAGDIFAACNVQRLVPYLHELQASLGRRADRSGPTIALLTPGPRHNDFFSHAYLAHYLGLQLVEGGDLRVSEDRVTLKTLNGLQPVDLIVRCIAGAYADPLELESTGFLGPVGLLRALRKSPGLVVNALGSALAQNRGLSSYLPALCRHLLGEDLIFSDAPRWWLGDVKLRSHVLAHLDEVVIRPAHEGTARPGKAVPGVDPARLSAHDRERLARDIEVRGASLVAEARTGFGTTPSLTPDGLVAKPYAARIFVVATGHGFIPIPGGLAMTVAADAPVALSAPDGEARDVWVVGANAPPAFVGIRHPITNTRDEYTTLHLPSRAADNLYWLGRYVEGADWTIRVLRTCLTRLQEDGAPRGGLRASRAALEILLSEDEGEVPDSHRPTDASLVVDLARTLMTSPEWECGLPRLIENIHRVASVTRDRLSSEAWRTLNDFDASGRWRADRIPTATADILRLLDEGLRVLAAFHGLSHENMTRSLGWSFLDMGRRLSRAFNMAELLSRLFGEPRPGEDEAGALSLALELADSLITYRSRYRVVPVLPLVLEQLLIDETSPRSIAFQLKELNRHIDALPQSGDGGRRIDEQRRVLTLLSSVQLAAAAELARIDERGTRPELVQLLDRLVSELPKLSDAVGRRYFNVIEQGVRWGRMDALTEP